MAEKTVDEVLTSLIRVKYPDYPTGTQDKVIADDLGLTAQSFSNYKLGKRTPTPAQAKTIASHWRAVLGNIDAACKRRLAEIGLPSDDRKLLAAVEEALLKAPIRQEFTLLDTILGTGNRDLVLSYLNYGVFSDGRRGLFDRICKRFFNQLGVEPTPKERLQFQGERSGETQVAQCYFATPSRPHATFLPFPLRISLGAVANLTHALKMNYTDWPNRLARSLYISQDDPTQTLPIRPIVVRDEVGHLHCRHTLGFGINDPRMTIVDAFEEGKILDALSNATIDEAGRIPVLIIDEYTALRVRSKAGNNAFMAVPITGSRTNRHSTFRRELPQFYMSLACPAKERQFSLLLKESLGQFFYTELETTARVFVDTFFKLEEEVYNCIAGLGSWSNDDYNPETEELRIGTYDAARPITEIEQRTIARNFALYTMSIDRLTVEDLSPYPDYWQRILRRTREIVQAATVRLKSTTDPNKPSGRRSETEHVLRSLLKDPPKGQAPVLRRYSQIQQMNEYTDYAFDFNQCRGRALEDLLAIVESQLCAPLGSGRERRLSDRQDEEIEVIAIDPKTAPWSNQTSFEINGILELINQLAQMYYNLPNPLPLPEEWTAQGPAPSLYGNVTDPEGRPVGGATIAVIDQRTAKSREAAANPGGFFIFESLDPGDYTVTAEFGDFPKIIAAGIALEGGSARKLDLRFDVFGPDNGPGRHRQAPPTEGREIFRRIEGEVTAKFLRYAQILLAVGKKTRGGKETLQHAGVVFILAEPGIADKPPLMATDLADREYLQSCCELRYLWVATPYRGRNVSRLLLADALEWCRTHGYSTARVAILPQLEDAIARVNAVQFKAVPALNYDKTVAWRRLIFEAKLKSQ